MEDRLGRSEVRQAKIQNKRRSSDLWREFPALGVQPNIPASIKVLKIMSWIILLALVIVASFASCSKERKVEEITVSGDMQVHGMKTDWKFTLPQGNPAEGRKLFVETECYKCHEVKGETFPAVGRGEKGIGPELSQMAGMHPPEFFAESIINPNAVIDPDATKLAYVGEDGKSKMPDYDSVLTVKQVADLAAYLSSLRKGESKGH